MRWRQLTSRKKEKWLMELERESGAALQETGHLTTSSGSERTSPQWASRLRLPPASAAIGQPVMVNPIWARGREGAPKVWSSHSSIYSWHHHDADRRARCYFVYYVIYYHECHLTPSPALHPHAHLATIALCKQALVHCPLRASIALLLLLGFTLPLLWYAVRRLPPV